MRAMICTDYGTPDVFQLQEVETPIPKDYEVRIKIHAASDVIFDKVGKRSFSQCKDSLTQSGVYLSTVLSLSIFLEMMKTMFFGKKKAIFVTAGLMQNQANLNFLSELYTSGKIKAVIDQRYPLEHLAEAHRYVDTGHKKGNVVISLV